MEDPSAPMAFIVDILGNILGGCCPSGGEFKVRVVVGYFAPHGGGVTFLHYHNVTLLQLWEEVIMLTLSTSEVLLITFTWFILLA